MFINRDRTEWHVCVEMQTTILYANLENVSLSVLLSCCCSLFMISFRAKASGISKSHVLPPTTLGILVLSVSVNGKEIFRHGTHWEEEHNRIQKSQAYLQGPGTGLGTIKVRIEPG